MKPEVAAQIRNQMNAKLVEKLRSENEALKTERDFYKTWADTLAHHKNVENAPPLWLVVATYEVERKERGYE